MKKLCSFCIAVVLVLAMLPQVAVLTFAAGDPSSVIASGTAWECDYDWTLTEDGVLTVSGGWDISTDVPWCDYVDDIRHLVVEGEVRAIGSEAFFGYQALTSVTLSNSVTTIEFGAFSGCESLKTVNLPEGLERVDSLAFADCRRLTSVTLPDSVEYLGDSVFRGCESLSSVRLPGGLKKIDSALFAGCSRLTSITIPEGVTVIGDWAFQECNNLQTVVIPNAVTKIGRGAFFGCTGLRQITIPANVVSVGDGAFSGCMELRDIIFEGDAPTFGEAVFQWVRATAFCSQDQGWTADVMQDYGGTIFWTDLSHVHSWGELPMIPPTCTEPGLYQGWGCAGCGWTKREPEVIPPEHQWDAGVYTEPTYDADGCTTYTCSGCGETRVEINEGSRLPEVVSAIVKQPQNVTTDSGNEALFAVAAQGDIVSYQWQYRKLYKWFNATMTGWDTDTLTVSATGICNGYDYRCVITFADGTVLISEPAELTVNTYITDIVGPSDQTVVLGQKGQFTVSATGEGLKYQWEYRRPHGRRWMETAMEGAKETTVYIETTVARDGYMYRCRITDAAGTVTYTEPATMEVLYACDPVEISAQPQAVTVAAGEVATFTVEATNVYAYQWQYRRPTGTVWCNTTAEGNRTAALSVTTKASNNGYQYRCILYGLDGTAYISDTATLTIS